MSLKGKIAIVTGGSRGIGKAIAATLAGQGAKVAVTYVSNSSLTSAKELLESVHANGGEIAIIQADSGSVEGPKTIVQETLKAFGVKTIDIIVNNAGVALVESIGSVTAESFEKTFNVNVRGIIFLVQEALPYLAKDGTARIVNIGSISSTAGFARQAVYGASKAAVEGLTRVLATELGRSHGATVNAINPGPVDTDMFSGVTPEFYKNVFDRFPPAVGERVATTQDIADIVLFLVEERSRWVSGDIVSSNGGGTYR